MGRKHSLRSYPPPLNFYGNNQNGWCVLFTFAVDSCIFHKGKQLKQRLEMEKFFCNEFYNGLEQTIVEPFLNEHQPTAPISIFYTKRFKLTA